MKRTVLRTARGRASPVGREEANGEKMAYQLYSGQSGKVLEEVGDSLERRLTLWGRGC
jgi:hypothetical protein